MSRFSRGIVAAGVLAALSFGLSPAGAEELDHTDLCDRDQSFSPEITNTYAGMRPGQVSTFFGFDDKVPLGLEIRVLESQMSFYDGTVTTAVVRETEWADKNANGEIDPKERLIEVSDNYFAQTHDGTVCYFGEDVQIYNKGGKFKGDTSGSWRADEPGNAPGIFMPARPREGDSFQMEDAPGIAEDEAEILETGLQKSVPAGTFERVIEVEDCNPLEGEDSCGIKYYAPNVGLIVDGPVELQPTP